MAKKRRLSKGVYQETYENREKGGSGRKGYIDWKKILGDRELKFFGPREGTNKVNIIPYEIKSKLHPLVKAGKAEIGELAFNLDVWAHRRLGPNEVDVLCPKKNYGKPCPACDKHEELKNEGKVKEADKFKPARRTWWNIQAIVQGEKQALSVFEVSNYFFGKELIDEAYECKDGDSIVPFADIDEGKIVKFRAVEETFQGNKFFKYKSFAFYDREEELDDDIVDEAISFDDGLVVLEPEAIESIMYGQDEDDEDDKPKGKTRDRDEDEDEEKPRKKDEDEEKPRKKDEDEEKPTKKSGNTECPNGHKWGTADDHKECKSCDKSLWEKCLDAGE